MGLFVRVKKCDWLKNRKSLPCRVHTDNTQSISILQRVVYPVYCGQRISNNDNVQDTNWIKLVIHMTRQMASFKMNLMNDLTGQSILFLSKRRWKIARPRFDYIVEFYQWKYLQLFINLLTLWYTESIIMQLSIMISKEFLKHTSSP